ncbi:MAG: hypothetical protein AAGD38_14800 [Acidobacteriota bacterium]
MRGDDEDLKPENADCRRHEASELIFRFVDEEMDREVLIAYRTHLTDCPMCAQQAAYTRRLLTVVRERSRPMTAPVTLRQRILAILPPKPH